MIVSIATRATPDLLILWNQALAEAIKLRGGRELIVAIRQGRSDDVLGADLIDGHCVWLARDNDDTLLGFSLCRDNVIDMLYVDRSWRRRGVARSMLNAMVQSANPPVDGLALPGDRATKSLYESFGWKARLLTMRGE